MKIRRLPLSLKIYRGFTRQFEFLVPLLLKSRLKKDKEILERLDERKGFYRFAPMERSEVLWVHAASVGELLAILPLINTLSERGFLLIVTTMTKTSALLAEQRLPKGAIHQFIPFDTQGAMIRFFEQWKPRLGLIVESELWPNMILEAKGRDIPLFLVNARLSQKSFLRWKSKPKAIETLLKSFELILAQSGEDAERFKSLNAPHVLTVGNLKYDVPAPAYNSSKLQDLQNQIGNRPVWLAASTHPQEEDMIFETHHRLSKHIPTLLTLVVPRHPDRGEALMALAQAHNLNAIRRSQGQGVHENCAVYIADTIGELGLFFRLAPFSFMGKSYEAKGGQNPIEPIKCHSLVFHGENVENFAQVYQALNEAKAAIMIKSAKHLQQQLFYYFYNEAEATKKCEAALRQVNLFGGSYARTLKILDPYLLQWGMEKL
jgi:3-deoxy-D-manno-octulosonic-acid transferase